MTAILVTALLLLVSIAACHGIAKRRGDNPVFWGVMGLLFVPADPAKSSPYRVLAAVRERGYDARLVDL